LTRLTSSTDFPVLGFGLLFRLGFGLLQVGLSASPQTALSASLWIGVSASLQVGLSASSPYGWVCVPARRSDAKVRNDLMLIRQK